MRFIITLALLLLCCIGMYAQQRLYLVAGQSNARGRGNDTFSIKVDTLTSYEYDPFSDQLIHLEDPVGYNGGGFEQAATGSAWPAFAKSYHHLTADTMVLIPAARGGSGVHYSSSSPGANWSSSGLLYPLSKIKIDNAEIISNLDLHGIVWMQGETDATRIGSDYLTKEQYKDALIDLIERYRNDYGCALPFYIVLLGTNLEDPVWGYDTVRVVQREIAAEQQHTYVVHEDAQYFGDIGWMWDNVHYTQDGYNDIGTVGASHVAAIENLYYTVSANRTDTICPGDSVLISAPPMYQSYLWSSGETQSEIYATSGGQYTVTVTDDIGCSFALDSVYVQAYEQARPTISIFGNDTLCVGENLLLAASTAPNHLWSTGETDITISANSTGDYFVQTIDIHGCLSEPSDTVSVTVIDFPEIIISMDHAPEICEGESVVLTAPSDFDTYQWSNGDTTQSITVYESGTFDCIVSSFGCPSPASESVTVAVAPLAPAPTITSFGPEDLCQGDSLTLTASNEFDRYLWSTGDTTQSITVHESGLYACAFIGTNDCLGISSSPLFTIFNPLPSKPIIEVDGDTEFCDGDNVILNVPTNYEAYLWSNGDTTSSITIQNSGTFSCYVTASNGCDSPPSDSIDILVHPPSPIPMITKNGSSTFCEGESVILTASSGYNSYEWSNGETTQSVTVSDSGVYICTVTDINDCTSVSAPENITVSPSPSAPNITSDGSLIFCKGEQVVLTAPPNYSAYSWSNEETTQSITVSDSGTYDCTVFNEAGCESPSSEALIVTVISNDVPPTISLSGPTTFCEGETLTLSASLGFDTYEWSNGENTPSITVSDSGMFSCIITSDNGCESPPSAAITVTVNPLPAAPFITTNNAIICEGDSTTLSVIENSGSYQWSTGETTQSITVYDAGIYNCLLTDTNGCTSPISNSITIDIASIDIPNITADGPTTFCEGENVTLSIPDEYANYQWSNGETTQSITVNESGSYDCIVTNSEGCQSPISEPVAVTVNQLPIAPVITPEGATTFCDGDNVILSAPIGFDKYEWSNGENTQSIIVHESGSYYCITINSNGCISPVSIPIEVTVNTLPSVPTIQAIGAPAFCEGDSVILVVSGGYSSYTWSNGEVGQAITVHNTGTFYCKVSNESGCVNTSTAFSTTKNEMLPKPEITFSGNQEFCEGESVTIFAESGYANYLWSTGETTQDITISENLDNIYCIVSDNNDCVSPPSDTTFVLVNPRPEQPYIDTIGTTNFCLGNTVQLSASEGYTHEWSTGETSETITVNSSGIYTVRVLSEKGCESEVAVPVEIIASTPPERSTISVVGSTGFCEGDSVVLSALPSAAYLWSNGDITQNIVVEQAGVFSCIVIDSVGCQSEPSFDITTEVFDNPLPPSISIFGDSILCPGDTTIIQAFSGAEEYFWSNGEVGKEIIVTTEGEYQCYVRDENDCKSEFSDSIKMELLPLPPVLNIQSSGDLTLCEGDSITLSADSGYLTYLWSTGDTSTHITVDYTGEFHYITTDSTSCSDPISKSIYIEVNPMPDNPFIIPMGIDTLCASETADEYNWYKNDTLTTYNTRCIIPDTDGTWQVTTALENCLSVHSAGFYFKLPTETGGGPASFDLYPNPNQGFLTIEANNIFEHNATFEIYDMLGRVLFSEELSLQNEPTFTHTIDIRQLPDAPYIAVLSAGISERFVKKFMVEGE